MNANTICDFLRQAIQELRGITTPDNYQWIPTKIKRTETGFELRQQKPQVFETLTHNYTLGHFSSIENFARILEANPHHRELKERERTNGALLYATQPEVLARSLLNEYLWQLDELQYDDERANQIAQNFSSCLVNQSSEAIYYSVIRGIECDFENCALPGDIQLRRLDDNEIAQLIDRHQFLLEEDSLPSNRWLLEQRIRLDLSFMPSKLNAVAQKFDEIVTALRLLKEGRVERQNVSARRANAGDIMLESARIGRKPRYPIWQTYNLSQSDLPNLIGILNAMQNRGTLPISLQTAIDRVNFAAERDRADDQLLDLITALEAMLGDSDGAIGYKIGLRCAVFVETNFETRQHIRILIKDAYKRRSALVHGGRSKGILQLTSEQLVSELATLVRKCINGIVRQLLSSGTVPNGEDFDDMLLQSS